MLIKDWLHIQLQYLPVHMSSHTAGTLLHIMTIVLPVQLLHRPEVLYKVLP